MHKYKTFLPKLFFGIDWYFILIFCLSFIPLVPLFHPGMFFGHDSQSHVARLVAFYQSLLDGNIVPRWAGELNMGYGHPILMFLYPLSNYFGSFWHFLGFGFIDSVKLVFGAGYLLSGIFMYLFGKSLFGQKIGLLFTVLFQFAPYRFVDLYTRAALGEHLAFTAVAVVFYALQNMFAKFSLRWFCVASLSVMLLILSHNALSLMFLLFALIFFSVKLFFDSHFNKNLFLFFWVLFMGLGLSCFFWLPAFFEGKYTLRDILTDNDFKDRFVDVWRLFLSPLRFGKEDNLVFEVGIIHWVGVLLGFFAFLSKKKNTSYYLLFVSEVFFLISVFFTTKFSQILWENFTFIQKFQFPWRFLSLCVLAGSFIFPFILINLPKSKKINAVIFAAVILTILSSRDFWKPKSFLEQTDRYFIHDYRGTTDTGESSPVWSTRGMEKKAKQRIELIGGLGKIDELKTTSTHHRFFVDAKTRIQLLDNTIYFPGWRVYVDSKPTVIEYQDLNHRGLITFYVEKGQHRIDVIFEDTKLRKTSNLISLISIIIIMGLFITSVFKKIKT